ncbi:hypothetical protein F3H64_01560 [Enterobacter hormaechei]|nr:hypothetical protein [Enterobacter hormaechei]MBQ5002825.1 hypothetical protein [Klebsiella pneumoniae]RTP57807.1 hypothetical protein EKN41_24205 [Enterobacter hormaechei]TCZ42113.1 hypothetical protein CA254_11300 [Enterobacter hormaechei]
MKKKCHSKNIGKTRDLNIKNHIFIVISRMLLETIFIMLIAMVIGLKRTLIIVLKMGGLTKIIWIET